MNRVAVRALELILCGLRAMLQGYIFQHPACLQEPSKIDLRPILYLSWKSDFDMYHVFRVHWRRGNVFNALDACSEFGCNADELAKGWGEAKKNMRIDPRNPDFWERNKEQRRMHIEPRNLDSQKQKL